MKILHTSDWHLGKQWHGVDRTPDLTDHIIPEIVQIALAEQVELMVVAGDIFDGFGRKSLNLCANLLRDPLKKLLEAGVNVALIAGNHDSSQMFELLQAALNINPLSKRAKLFIFTKPSLQVCDGVQLIGVPYLALHKLKRLLATKKINLPVEDDLQNKVLSRQYERILQIIKEKKLNSGKPAVLIGHFSVSGAKLRLESSQEQKSYWGYETSYATDLTISREALLASDQIPQYNALGHIHLAQSVPETVVPTYYAGAPDYFERGQEKYQPQVLLVDLPERGKVNVSPVFLKSTTPFINKTLTNTAELRALADELGDKACRRVLGDIRIKVADIVDFPPLRDEAYRLFPRLQKANTVRVETPKEASVRFEATDDYAQIAKPRLVLNEYLGQNFSDEELPRLQKALDMILEELEHEN